MLATITASILISFLSLTCVSVLNETVLLLYQSLSCLKLERPGPVLEDYVCVCVCAVGHEAKASEGADEEVQ